MAEHNKIDWDLMVGVCVGKNKEDIKSDFIQEFVSLYGKTEEEFWEEVKRLESQRVV